MFSTKIRAPYLLEGVRERLFTYAGGAAKGLGVLPIAIGGHEDHIHFLLGLKPTQNVSEIVREIKKATNQWMKEEAKVVNFGWQDGYAVVSVSPENVDKVVRYIENQAERHQKVSFMDELAAMLKFSNIEYDPKYLE